MKKLEVLAYIARKNNCRAERSVVIDDLVYLKNEQAVCDSLQVAEKFGKRHSDVIRAIENLLANDSTQNCVQCIKPSKYKDASGKYNKKYLLNKDGFVFLAFGFTGLEKRRMPGNGSILMRSIGWKDLFMKRILLLIR